MQLYRARRIELFCIWESKYHAWVALSIEKEYRGWITGMKIKFLRKIVQFKGRRIQGTTFAVKFIHMHRARQDREKTESYLYS